MTGGDRRSADQHAAFCTENTIGDEPAGYREQVNGHRVGAIDAAGGGRLEAQAAGGGGRHHEQRQQRTHPVVREALPQLGKIQSREAGGMRLKP